MESYFAGMVDNDYFGVLAVFCFFVGVAGLFPSVRGKRLYKVLNFICVMAIPVMFALGVYYLTNSSV
ncbi:apolipoprotein N-acyltransferase [Pseudomonas sp. GGS8]|uniref:hypothetical protein n=1 Tax=Pseudomonas sp. GGS8 TaxID=2817892 RepID=UPI0020A15316|nr:hypothetical protein [Pseudomonas sp. GGS8]MCP1442622.1 apolipoprotein N-acyltransferase [Pseudomonas sp. GGS8]